MSPRSLYRQWKLNKLKQAGLQIADDCRLVNLPDFGSEPYLVSIGRHVTLSADVVFHTHDGGTWVFRDQPEYGDVIKFGRITIHDNCFIGSNAILLPGVTIGPGSVVGSGSVVSRDVPPGTVVAGVPARHICTVEEYAARARQRTPDYDRQRYHADQRAELLRLYPYPW